MPFEKVQFEFPVPKDGSQSTEIEVEPASNVLDVTPKPTTAPKPTAKSEPADKDIEIEVVSDVPPKDRNRKASPPPNEVTDEELEEYSEKVQKRIKQFTKGYHDERRKAEAAIREREEAIRLAQKLLEENNQLKESVNKNQEVLLEQAKARVEMELQQAKRAQKEAYESGDADKLATATEMLAKAANKAERVAALKPSPLQKQETLIKPEITTSDTSVDQKAVEWQKSNPWFGEDDEMTSFALGLHQKLVKEGVDTQSDEYYERINRRMRQVFPDQFSDSDDEDIEEKPAAKPRKSANVVAPVTRSTMPKKVRLTDSQVALAKRLGVPLELYAREVAEEMMRNRNG